MISMHMDECRMIVESNLQMFFELVETKQLKVIERERGGGRNVDN
jgi:hypothetical protein